MGRGGRGGIAAIPIIMPQPAAETESTTVVVLRVFAAVITFTAVTTVVKATTAVATVTAPAVTAPAVTAPTVKTHCGFGLQFLCESESGELG